MKTIFYKNQSRLFIFMVVTLALAFTAEGNCFEKTGTTSLQFLSVKPSARANALGGAFTTLADNAEACFWNPAAITRVNGMDISTSYIDYFLDVKLFSLAGVYNTDNWGTFGAFALYSDVGSIEVTTVDALRFNSDKTFNPGITGETFSPTQFVGGISYAASLTESFSFGINVKYIVEDLVFEKLATVAFDGGILFKTGYKSIIIGAALKNFGSDVKFIANKYPIPQTMNIGASANLIGTTDQNLLVESNTSVLRVAYDLSQLRDFDQQHIVGVEYGLDDMLFLRGGYKFNGDQETYSGGFGVKYQDIRFDYSYNPFGEYLPAVHRVSIGYALQ